MNTNGATILERRNSLYEAALGKYKDKGFTLYEPQNASIELQLDQYGAMVYQFKYGEAHPSTLDIQAICQSWLIKNGDFGTLGITIEAQS